MFQHIVCCQTAILMVFWSFGVALTGEDLEQLTPRSKFVLTGVTNVEKVVQLTGKDSLNSTETYQVYGTDLGSMWEYQGKMVMVFGDTFGSKRDKQSGPGGENWRSNVMAVSGDMDPSDGISFDTMICDEQGRAKELLFAQKVDNHEITVIPAHVFAVNEELYIGQKMGTAGTLDL